MRPSGEAQLCIFFDYVPNNRLKIILTVGWLLAMIRVLVNRITILIDSTFRKVKRFGVCFFTQPLNPFNVIFPYKPVAQFATDSFQKEEKLNEKRTKNKEISRAENSCPVEYFMEIFWLRLRSIRRPCFKSYYQNRCQLSLLPQSPFHGSVILIGCKKAHVSLDINLAEIVAT